MASFATTDPAEQAQALREAVDRVLRAQEYSVRGVRVKRPELDKLVQATLTLDKLANVNPTMCSVGQIGCPTSSFD